MFAFKSPLALLPVIFSALSPVLAQPVDEAIVERSASNMNLFTRDYGGPVIDFFFITHSTCDPTTIFPGLYIKEAFGSIWGGECQQFVNASGVATDVWSIGV